jgi:protein subunit release factor B
MADFPEFLGAPLQARFVSLGVRPEEIEEAFIRGSGAGGQKINKTSSTVWLRHGPTGTEVRCQRERSQTTNRLLAWQGLAGRLEARAASAVQAVRDERELERRQTRQKSRGQKRRMVAAKKHRARIKGARRGGSDGW